MNFTDNIMEDLKKKGLTDKSISLYIKNLKNINGKEDFSNFNFLKKVDDVNAFLHKFKPSTRKSYMGCILSVLGMYPTNKVLTNLKNKYFILFNDENAKLKESVNEKTETQKENWIDWEDVLNIWKEKHKEILAITIPPKKKGSAVKPLTDAEYTKLLNFVVLSLYVLTPPRRNEDYLKMVISPEGEDLTKNYLDLEGEGVSPLKPREGMFIFNAFKTSGKYPKQKIPIPPELMTIIRLYLRYYPKQPIENGSNFLVFSDGSPLEKINVITRILNKMFKKNVGVSMLRHSYLTHKYGEINAEKEKDAMEMGHSLATQNDYVKRGETP